MKKILSFLLAFAMIISCMAIGANAVSFDEGKETLREQFVYGKGPKVNGYDIDYRYFSPVKDGDSQKYPVVVWVHGHSHGQYEGYQIVSNDIVNWASEEYQARFKDVGGAYIMAVRAPEDLGISWGDELVTPLKAAIDDFIISNKANIDTTKIYIGGFSLGGMMTFKMASEYPDMFAAIFPICPYIKISENDAKSFADIPVWLVSGKSDPLVSYSLKTVKNWNAVVNTTSVPADCRFSTLAKVCEPDGSPTLTAHYSWVAVTYDMFSSENGPYPHMSTVTGTGNDISVDYPDGMISWLSSFSSEYNPDANAEENLGTKINIISILFAPITKVYIVIRNLFRPIFG